MIYGGTALKIRRNVFVLGFLYILIVFLFASIYYFFWQQNPDNFIVQDETNLFPITELWQFLQSEDIDNPLYDPSETAFSLNDVSSITEEQKQKLINAYSEMKRLQDLSNLQWQQISDFNTKLTETGNENFEKYFGSQTLTLRDHEQELLSKISSLETMAASNSNPEVGLQLQLEISSLNVELIQTRIDILDKEYELYQEYLNDPRKFQEPKLVALRDNLYTSYQENQTKLNGVRDSYYKLRADIHGLWMDLRDARTQRLSYFDFMYFSLTISLASPFGDIIPNNQIIRILVFLQLFIDIFLIGYFVSSFTDLFRKKSLQDFQQRRGRLRRKKNRNQ